MGSPKKIQWSLLVSQSFFPHQAALVGGFKHLDYFPFHIWEVILPIDELIFFKIVFAPPTSAIFRQKMPELRRTRNDDHRMDFIGFFRWFLTLMSSGTVIYHLPSGK